MTKKSGSVSVSDSFEKIFPDTVTVTVTKEVDLTVI
jgi:hypothetical protein